MPVHPRLRGELVTNRVVRFVDNGSSPLTRGTPELHMNLAEDVRFIPAYAGNSKYFE